MSSVAILAYKRDLHPKQFVVIVFLGCLASTLLSSLQIPPWVSLIFAGGIMIWLAVKRWQIARENDKDYQSLEAFAEDIYLLGYLLTLAALLGLAPRLLSEEKHLFHIAAVKLVTTVLGLALMMVFRQTARRWAEEQQTEEAKKLVEQQKLFSDAVGRLCKGADQLLSKLDEVVSWFDPKLLEPLSEWSNRAAATFAKAASELEAVPAAVSGSLQKLEALGKDLARVQAAAAELAGVITAGTAQAALVLAEEMGNARQAVQGFGAAVMALGPAAQAAKEGMDNLHTGAASSAEGMRGVAESSRHAALELGKVERSLKKLGELETKEVGTSMTRLAAALDSAGEKTASSGHRIELLSAGLKGFVAASQELGTRLQEELGKPLGAQQLALTALQEKLELAVERIAFLAQQMEIAAANEQLTNGLGKELLQHLADLRELMRDTNGSMRALVKRIDGGRGADQRPKGLLGFLGGRR